MVVEYSPPTKLNQEEAEKNFKEFLEDPVVKQEIDKLKKAFPKATKAGIKDLLFFIWLTEILRGGKKRGFIKRVFSLARGLLGVLFVSSWIKGLSRFKLIGDRI